MSVLDFPANPTNGQYFSGYIWNAANETWDSSFAPRPATIPIATPNAIINGGFDIWQRGTGFVSPANGAYTADRWSVVFSTNVAISTDVPTGFNYSLELSGTTTPSINYKMEAAEASFYVDKVVTFSIWAKNVTGSTNLTCELFVPTARDNFASLTSISTQVLSASPSSSWTRYSVSFTVPAGGVNGIQLRIARGNGTTTTRFDGAQFEVGAAPTEFRRNTPNLQAELAACQRYFEKSYAQEIAPGAFSTNGMVTFYGSSDNGANVVAPVKFAVPKRISGGYTLTTYNAVQVSGQISFNRSGSSGSGAGIVYRANDAMFHVYTGVGIGWGVANIEFHWTCSAEL
jgi:hypothetical protein